VYRRVAKLSEHGYIQRRQDSSTEKAIFAISKKGAEELVEREEASEEIFSSIVRLNERRKSTLDYALTLTQVHVCFELAGRVSPIKLMHWQNEGKVIYDKVTVRERVKDGKCRVESKEVTYPVRPDGFLMFHDTRRPEGENRAPFFPEVELQRLKLERFQDKIKGYEYYHDQGLHTKRGLVSKILG